MDDRPFWAEDAELRAEAEGLREQHRKANANGHGGEEPLVPIDPTKYHGLPVPQRRWLVPGWVPMARATGLYGGGGEGKTLLAQMLATACALGEPWLGLPVRRCNSVLQFCEDDEEEMWRRQEDINRLYGCTFADLGAMRWLPRLGFDSALMTSDAGRRRLTPLFNELLRGSKAHGAGLVGTDTLADVFGGSENDRAQARAFVQTALGGLARQTGGAIMALAHPSLSGATSGSGTSGSTGWVGPFRAHLYLSSPKEEEGEAPDPDARKLTRGKANFARRGETIEMRWRDGVFIASRPPSGIIGSIEKRACERVFLDLLDRIASEGQRVSHNSRAGNYAPKVFSLRPDRDGYKTADFERAMHALLSCKEIVVASYQSGDRHTREILVRAATGAAA